MKSITISVVVFAVLLEFAHGFPSAPNDTNTNDTRGRQDEDASPVNPNGVGFNVAQIIIGALTGNIDSIVKASFGFIGDKNVNTLSHNYWEHLKGNPTQTPPWLTTSRPTTPSPQENEFDPDSETETPRPQYVTAPVSQAPVKQYQPAAQTPQVAQVAPVPTQQLPLVVDPDSGPLPSELYSQVATQFNPTSSPVRTTQPTYATLAPLYIIEGISHTTPRPSISTGGDDEDVDESESESKGRIVKGPDATVSNKLQ